MKKTILQQIQVTPEKVERAFLVGLQTGSQTPHEVEELLLELGELADTLGVTVAGQMMVRLGRPQPRYLVGSGKALEIVEAARRERADVIVFDDPLTPSQQRNWEKLSDLAVIDREEVILDIFGQRAQTREAELQIALARAEYDLPRLKRRWTHLSRQRGMRGGAGMRGEGEQQIEVDARLVQRRISTLRQQLEEVRKKRTVQRKKRMKKPVPNAALVGYTNAGKSSVLNALTGAHVFVEDKLFATLDPTTRRVLLPNQQELLLSDTVGFIRKLPHSLIEAFKATLEEAMVADFILEVIDINSNQVEEHHQTTVAVLGELGITDKWSIPVFNKTDLVDDEFTIARLHRRYPDALFVSAHTGDGMEQLKERLAVELARRFAPVELLIPHQRYDLVALIHRTGTILSEKSVAKGLRITATVPPETASATREFAVRTRKKE